MSRDSASQGVQQLRTLYALGVVGGLTDARLVERFLGRAGQDREDAFAALVQRHGPMVLRVCRRMLGGSADAEDAFQAVFLVLARKAKSVRRHDGLKPWLYGVAVRTAKEARKRSARRRAREGGAMEESRAVSAPEDGRGDLLALLDEEIDRLPGRYRDPVMLCDLEGASRETAARQLGVPEGTLSSRLSRGRSLLRDRLVRRGVSPAAVAFPGLIAEPAGPVLTEPLAAAAARLALKFAAGGAAAGTVPVGVASLAEGVLGMIFAAELKLILITAAAAGAAACLTAGLTLAVGPTGAVQSPPEGKAPAPVAATRGNAVGKKVASRPIEVRGVVVDEAGRPAVGVNVRADSDTPAVAGGITGADGSFAFRIGRPRLDNTTLIARSPADGRLGLFRFGFNLTKEAASTPARIVLKPGREVLVRVVDAAKVPIPGAAVEVAGDFTVFDHATTDPDGVADVHIPADARVEWVVSMKPGRGFDYAEFGEFDQHGRSRRGSPAADVPASLDLTLDSPRVGKIKAVDAGGRPLGGVEFTPWLLQKEGRKSQVNYASRVLRATTGADGVATFDWLPRAKGLLQFWPVGDGYARRRVILEEGATGPVTATLSPTEVIRGRVLRPDGAGAPSVVIHAFGSGRVNGFDHGQGQARTADDGSYEIRVNAGEAYAVYVDDPDWAAPSRLDVVVRDGKPAEGVDFALTRGTVVRGTVTVGSGGNPAANQYIRFIESGGQAPAEVRDEGDRYWREVQRQFGATTDAAGGYSLRVGPGTYTVVGPPRTGDEKITVKNEPELVRDYRMPRPEKGPVSGRVTFAGKGVGGATVEVFAASPTHGIPFTLTTDAEGRFRGERSLDRCFLHARNADGSLGAIVEIGPEDPAVDIEVAPTATARGVLLDEAGNPAANQPLAWGRRIFLDEGRKLSTEAFAPKVKTDGAGRFTLPSLVVGQEYDIALERAGTYHAAGVVKPDSAAPIDLGTIRAGAYQPPSLANAEEQSSFNQDAPGPGAVAPPIEAMTLDGKKITLDDFKGKYVLLDFWATWCGPCLAEIPRLQAVHEAFRKDERFVILSVSVDEAVEGPRKFQENRKLPWPQAFLAGGLHGPGPGTFGVRAIPAFVLVGPDGRIVARGMRGEEIRKVVTRALATP